MFTFLSLFLIGVGSVLAIDFPIHGGPIYHSSAIIKPLVKEVEAPAHYDFAYAVHDDHTGDVKSQTESRKDDQVHGQYSLIDADGFIRTVEYTSDDHNGFNAVVRREPIGHKAPIPVAKVAYAAPKVAIGHFGFAH